MAKYITLDTLSYFKTKLESLFIQKEYKTGSTTEYKTLSDNNLTDALKEKIESAGTSSFSGSYADLSSKPTINGHEVTGAMTLADLGIDKAYKIKGSKTFASLPTLSSSEEGNVYNVTDAFTTTADFVEGAGKKYGAGANVVCVEEEEGVYKFDVLAGFIDTDAFVKSTDIEAVTEAEIDALFAA